MVKLKNCEPQDFSSTETESNLQARPRSKFARYFRMQVLSFRRCAARQYHLSFALLLASSDDRGGGDCFQSFFRPSRPSTDNAPAERPPTAIPPAARPPMAMAPSAKPPIAIKPTEIPPNATIPIALPPRARMPRALPPRAMYPRAEPPSASQPRLRHQLR